jgi:hypothetical protein
VSGALLGWGNEWLKVHKLAGQAFEYLVPLHIGAVGMHAVKGQNILSRLAPFASKAA